LEKGIWQKFKPKKLNYFREACEVRLTVFCRFITGYCFSGRFSAPREFASLNDRLGCGGGVLPLVES
jgi:hypothetical protein